ncbi:MULTISPECIES: profilin [Actinomadura]|uniref:Profilin n=1 Tax=Actinomadura yumaensis TaxID=111807 RepID=A0ABW2CFR6_9ACTN|nr:profilin [Actinomadura sp. J1-007]MWK34974.1 hypothetical protein [Actinomadura sp. J1-007]
MTDPDEAAGIPERSRAYVRKGSDMAENVWQSLVDGKLLGSGKVSRAAILGQQGGVLATSEGFALSAQEQQAIIEAFRDPAAVLATGLRLAGIKYFAWSADPGIIIVRKQADGAILVKTRQTVLVAVYQAPTMAQEAMPVVESLADELVNAGD